MGSKFVVKQRKKTETGKGYNRKLRNAALPHNSGIVYGFEEPINISMRSDHAAAFIRNHLNSSSPIIALEIETDDKPIKKNVVLQDYQLVPANNRLLHVDFREVSPSSVIQLDVPINPTGVSKGVKAGGVLQLLRREITLRGKVSQIPTTIDIDISELDFGGNVHIEDIALPKDVIPVVAKGDNFTVLTISAPVEEEEEISTDQETLAAEAVSESEESAAADGQ